MEKTLAVIGAGLIGRAWAMVFARAGWRVRLHDRDARATRRGARRSSRRASTSRRVTGSSPSRRRRWRASTIVPALADALAGVDWVQENLPEMLDVKREVFAALDRHAPPEAVLASSTSAIPPSQFTETLPGRARCLVAHPVNPPHLVPVVELCGAPWTAPAVIERAKRVYADVGQVPDRREPRDRRVHPEPAAGRVAAEAMRLVGEGYVSAEDLDKTVRDGLGLRWSFMGPLATIELNAPGGIADYCARYSGFYRRLAEAPPAPSVWDARSAERSPRTLGPPPDAQRLDARTRWRDRRLMALAPTQAEQSEIE